MQVSVLLFAAVREAAGRQEVTVEVSDEATAREVLDQLTIQIPAAAALIPLSRLAIDGRYVDGDTAIASPDSELALIPPVSGG